MPFFPEATINAGIPWLPGDNGLIDATTDPVLSGVNSLMIAGTLYLVKIAARAPFTITNLWIQIQAAGLGASTGSFAGLYSPAGLLLTGSADIGGSLLSAANVSLPVTTPQPVAAGSFVWAALLVNLASTQPTLRAGAGNSATAANINLANTGWRYATNGTGLVALPGSIVPGSNLQGAALTFWMGVS